MNIKADAVAKDRLESALYRAEEAKKGMDKDRKKQLDEAIKAGKRALKSKDPQQMNASAETLEGWIGQSGA